MSKSLPDGWKMVKFVDVVNNIMTTEKDPLNNGLERYVGLDDIDPNDLRLKRWGLIKDGTTFTKVFRRGQLLFGKRRAYQRKVGLTDFDGLCSGDILVFEANNKKLIPELLPFIVQSDKFFERALDTSAGSLSPRTKWKDLANFEFPLPPLAEQKRIAEVLWAVEHSIWKTEDAIGVAEGYKKRMMTHLFMYGPVSVEKASKMSMKNTKIGKIPDNWTVKNIEDLCEILDSMRVPITESDREKGSIPYYGANGVLDYVKDYIFNEDLVLVGEDGADWSPYANTAYIIQGKSWVNNHAHVLRCIDIDSVFLTEYLNMMDLRKYVSGTTRGKLNQSELKRIPIPVPPNSTLTKISVVLSKLNNTIQNSQAHTPSQKYLKNKLLTDLLSGEVILGGKSHV